MTTNNVAPRIAFIDIARFYGILLVYYGHVIESVMNQKVAIAGAQYKFIYSFHMPLFFVIAGFVAKDITQDTRAWQTLMKLLHGRIVPYIFFTILLIIPTFFLAGNHGQLDFTTWASYKWALGATFKLGLPSFNIPTWFLLGIFAVEILHLVVGRFFTSKVKILGGILFFYLFGSWFCTTFDLYNPVKGRLFSYFYFQEALVAYAFYLFGYFLHKQNVFNSSSRALGKFCALWALPLALVVFLTYDLNKNHFSFSPYDAVVILFSSHGHAFWFAITATVGSLMVLVLARGTRQSRIFNYLGGNTLVLFCLNGVFYHFVNDRLAAIIAPRFTGSVELTVICLVITITSIALAAPFISLFNNYVPWFIGRKSTGKQDVFLEKNGTSPEGASS